MTLFITVHKRQSLGAAGILHLSCGQTCQSSGSTSEVREAVVGASSISSAGLGSSLPGKGAGLGSKGAMRGDESSWHTIAHPRIALLE
jgi:hypothetical protein